MNKFGIVLGAAAIATFAGCKDPDYKYASASPSQTEVKSVGTAPAEAKPVATIEPMSAPSCKCAPGTRHAEPCKCGASDCRCIVEPNVAPIPVAAEPVVTEYVVQEGDFLSKISSRYNVTISSIRRLNPSIKKDVIRVGQKIKLPGKIDIGAQKAPVKTAKVVKRSGSTAAYTGATKEYAVKSGDTLGSIAYGNGINIRQLKRLNNLTSDSLKIGQKLKVPAEKVAAASTAKTSSAKASVAKKAEAAAPAPDVAAPVAAEKVEEEKKEDAVPAPAAAAEEKKEAAPAEAAAPAKEAAPVPTYVVQEGDDMTGVSIRWGVTAAQIRELNNLGENDQLVPGQIIKLPAEAQQ